MVGGSFINGWVTQSNASYIMTKTIMFFRKVTVFDKVTVFPLFTIFIIIRNVFHVIAYLR